MMHTGWLNSDSPPTLTLPAHGASVVTCLLFSHNRIISGSDDHSIHVYSPVTGQQLYSFTGHEGGVWALAATTNILVSGSTDRTVRVWDLNNGRCTHVFGGHTSTVRCLAIVKPEWLDIETEGGGIKREKWPKRAMIVTGSRDHTLRLWTLPKPGDEEYVCRGANESEDGLAEENTDENPYHLRVLTGHGDAIRALAARGRTLASASYDFTVRIWDIIDGVCTWTLTGHTQKVYCVVLDPVRSQCCSGSMDGTVRIWSLKTGQCLHNLQGHTSLVGLLGISPSHLVSGAADSTVCVWDPSTGKLRHTLAAHTGAITCFQHDEFKVLSGSDGTLKLWDIRDGSFVRNLLTGTIGVWQVIWQVVFDGRWCVAASTKADKTYLDVWDFGRDSDDPELFGETEGNLYDENSEDETERGSVQDRGPDADVADVAGVVEMAEDREDTSTNRPVIAGQSAAPSSRSQ